MLFLSRTSSETSVKHFESPAGWGGLEALATNCGRSGFALARAVAGQVGSIDISASAFLTNLYAFGQHRFVCLRKTTGRFYPPTHSQELSESDAAAEW